MRHYFLLLLCWCGLMCSHSSHSKPQAVLLFTKTAGFRHASIPDGIAAIQQLGRQQGFAVDTSSNALLFTPANLRRYRAVILLNTTGNLFDPDQQQALQDFVESGGGLLGIHAAADAECDWPWYAQAMSACFESHPQPQQAKLVVQNASHPATRMLPQQWQRFDEWYNFQKLPADVQVLVTIDEKSYSGGKHGDVHPMVWWQNVGRGKVFYTALGHTSESYTEPLFVQHLSGAIQFVISTK